MKKNVAVFLKDESKNRVFLEIEESEVELKKNDNKVGNAWNFYRQYVISSTQN